MGSAETSGSGQAGVPEDGLAGAARRLAILAIVLPLMLSVLDSSIVNVALPSIGRDVGADPARAIWVVKIYLLVVVMLLLPLASLGEIIGYRLISRTGVVIFTAASLACAMTRSAEALTVARAVQAVGAAGILSVNVALTRFIYPRRLLGRGIGMIAFTVATSNAIGPTVASAILAVASWPVLFLVNVPLGLLALVASRTLPRTPTASGRRLDAPAVGLYMLAIVLLVLCIDAIGESRPPWLVGALAAALVLALVLLVVRERRREVPLLPTDLLRIPMFRLSVLTSICSFVAFTMAFVALPFFIQGALGQSETMTGLLMTPWPLTTAIMAVVSGRLADRYPAGILGGLGLFAFAAGLGLLALLPPHAALADIGWRMAVCGFGFGLFQSPNNRAMIGAAPLVRSGAASGMLGTGRMLGQTLGASLTGLIVALGTAQAFAIALGVAAAIAALGALVSLSRLSLPPPARPAGIGTEGRP